MQVAGVSIIEVAKLESLTRAAADCVKAFVSRATDRFRPPYGSRIIEQPWQSVSAGSVNHSAYLHDEMGPGGFGP
jgi:predicted P-loop ATPase